MTRRDWRTVAAAFIAAVAAIAVLAILSGTRVST